MRFIKTNNGFIEFVEADTSGEILSSRGFQLGETYFQIKNGRVTFYLKDSENPYTNDVWTCNIPLMIDDVVYNTAEEVSAALSAIMNGDFQNQLDNLKDEIDDEETRAISAETALQGYINELSGTAATISSELGNLESDVNSEISRSVAKDASHDAEISGLTNSLQNEISRATGTENSLRNDLNAEVSARTTADAAQLQRITALEVGKADASSVYSKTESDERFERKGSYATEDFVRGYTYDKHTIDEKVSGSTFDPERYYDKTATDALLDEKLAISDFETYSGEVSSSLAEKASQSDLNALNGTVTAHTNNADVHVTQNEKNVWNNKQNTLVAGTGISIINDVIAVTASSPTVDAYTKAESDEKFATITNFNSHSGNTNAHVSSTEKNTWNNKQNALTAGTGISIVNDVISVTASSPTVDAYTKAESDAKFATITNFNSHSGNTTAHITSAERTTWNNKQSALTAGSGITISNNVISAKIWSGTIEQYNQLPTKDNDCIYLIHS